MSPSHGGTSKRVRAAVVFHVVVMASGDTAMDPDTLDNDGNGTWYLSNEALTFRGRTYALEFLVHSLPPLNGQMVDAFLSPARGIDTRLI